MIELAVNLNKLLQSNSGVFLRCSPELLDFTQNINFKIKVNDLIIEVDDLLNILSLLKTAINIPIIAWNIKNLYSYALFKTGTHLQFETKVFDLRIAESFLGMDKKIPVDYAEAKERFKAVIADWGNFKNLYQQIYFPLLSEVIPSIESEGLIQDRKILYSCYDVSGHGRLSCYKAFDNYFLPHTLSREQRAIIKPKGNEYSFLYFDFHCMEVSMMAWLSKDAYLSELVNGKEDFYKVLYKLITGVSDDNKRDLCKNIFLPVVYGQQAKSLAKNLNFTIGTAEKIISRLEKLFPKLFDWLGSYRNIDYFGRKRYFEGGEEYKYRNFIVQAPAAMVCLERLIGLYQELQDYGIIVATIHDGYLVKAKQVEITKAICMRSLETESKLCPGLKLKVNYKNYVDS